MMARYQAAFLEPFHAAATAETFLAHPWLRGFWQRVEQVEKKPHRQAVSTKADVLLLIRRRIVTLF